MKGRLHIGRCCGPCVDAPDPPSPPLTGCAAIPDPNQLKIDYWFEADSANLPQAGGTNWRQRLRAGFVNWTAITHEYTINQTRQGGINPYVRGLYLYLRFLWRDSVPGNVSGLISLITDRDGPGSTFGWDGGSYHFDSPVVNIGSLVKYQIKRMNVDLIANTADWQEVLWIDNVLVFETPSRPGPAENTINEIERYGCEAIATGEYDAPSSNLEPVSCLNLTMQYEY